MDIKKLKELAGISIAEGKKWSGDVDAKVEIPEGLFTKKAAKIVSTLVKLHGGDLGKAMKALSFYINRAGKGVENADELEKAKELLKDKEAKAKMNEVRSLAGLPLLREDAADGDGDGDADDSSSESKKDGEDEEETIPSIVKKIAKKAEGKSADELEDLIMKVYDAGMKDGRKAAEEEQEGGEEGSEENKNKE